MLKKVTELTKELEKSKLRLEKERDIIKGIESELEDLHEAVTGGIDGVGEALVFLNDAIQDMSRLI